MHCGDTLLFDADVISPSIQIDPSATPNLHLWIVITEPQPPDFQCVIVSLTDRRKKPDQTVILQPGEHPFITKESIIWYGDARFADARWLDELVRRGTAKLRDPCTPDLLKRIQEGTRVSRFIAKKLASFCDERF